MTNRQRLEPRFTWGQVTILGELSVDLGRLYWNEERISWRQQVAILTRQHRRLTKLVLAAKKRGV